jgi:hypothetical protein
VHADEAGRPGEQNLHCCSALCSSMSFAYLR